MHYILSEGYVKLLQNLVYEGYYFSMIHGDWFLFFPDGRKLINISPEAFSELQILLNMNMQIRGLDVIWRYLP